MDYTKQKEFLDYMNKFLDEIIKNENDLKSSDKCKSQDYKEEIKTNEELKPQKASPELYLFFQNLLQIKETLNFSIEKCEKVFDELSSNIKMIKFISKSLDELIKYDDENQSK